jgi:hypothetical protein
LPTSRGHFIEGRYIPVGAQKAGYSIVDQCDGILSARKIGHCPRSAVLDYYGLVMVVNANWLVLLSLMMDLALM